jgi:hypothetical protein
MNFRSSSNTFSRIIWQNLGAGLGFFVSSRFVPSVGLSRLKRQACHKSNRMERKQQVRYGSGNLELVS